jgi:hypothetical protein
MEADLFKTLRQVTGIGRIALGVALPLLRDVINRALWLFGWGAFRPSGYCVC